MNNINNLIDTNLFYFLQCPHQENGINCGYFVMRFMKEILISKLNEIPNLVCYFYIKV